MRDLRDWTTVAVLVAFGLAIAVFTAPAHAAPCMDRQEFADAAKDRYGEYPVFHGVMPEAIVEVWLNEETGTWTVTLTLPNGMACVPAVGRRGALVEPDQPGEDS